MRRLLAGALVLLAGVGMSCAQRGGAAGGGRSSAGTRGFSVSRSPGNVGSFRTQGYLHGYQTGGRPPIVGRAMPNYGGRVAPGTRPMFYTRGRGKPRRGLGGGVPYVYGGPLSYGLLDADDPGYDPNGYNPDDAQNGRAEDPGLQGGNYVEQPEAAYAGSMPEDPASVEGGTVQQDNVPARQSAAPELYDSNAVTLIFKDGRPNETIHNYALTRTMLFVTDGRHRQIPVADLDMAATAKANSAAGVEFQLPH